MFSLFTVVFCTEDANLEASDTLGDGFKLKRGARVILVLVRKCFADFVFFTTCRTCGDSSSTRTSSSCLLHLLNLSFSQERRLALSVARNKDFKRLSLQEPTSGFQAKKYFRLHFAHVLCLPSQYFCRFYNF